MLFEAQQYAWQLVLSAALTVAAQVGLVEDDNAQTWFASPNSVGHVSQDDNLPLSGSPVENERSRQEKDDQESRDSETNSRVSPSHTVTKPPQVDATRDEEDGLEASPTQDVNLPANGESSASESGSGSSWIRRGSYREGDVDYRLVTAGPAYLQRMSEAELNELIVETTNDYIDEWLGPQASSYVSYDLKTIRERLLVPEHYQHEKQRYDVGVMYQSYAQLRFDAPFRRELGQKWRVARKRQRLIHGGLIGAGVLSFLALAYGYLRLDYATRGFYTGRLQFMGGLAVLAIIAVETIALSSFPWI